MNPIYLKKINSTQFFSRLAATGLVSSSFLIGYPAIAQVNPTPSTLNEPLYQTGGQITSPPPISEVPAPEQSASAYPTIFSEPLYNGTPVSDQQPIPNGQSAPGGTPFPANPLTPGAISPDAPQFPSQVVPEPSQNPIAPSRPQLLDPIAPSNMPFSQGSYPYQIDPSRTPAQVEATPQVR